MGAGKSKSVVLPSIGNYSPDESLGYTSLITPEQGQVLHNKLSTLFSGQIHRDGDSTYPSALEKKHGFDSSYADFLLKNFGVPVQHLSKKELGLGKKVKPDSFYLEKFLLENVPSGVKASDCIKLYKKIVDRDPETRDFLISGFYGMYVNMKRSSVFKLSKKEQYIMDNTDFGPKTSIIFAKALARAVGYDLSPGKKVPIESHRVSKDELGSGREYGYTGVNVSMRTIGLLLGVAKEHGISNIISELDFNDTLSKGGGSGGTMGYFHMASKSITMLPLGTKSPVTEFNTFSTHNISQSVSGTSSHEFGHAFDNYIASRPGNLYFKDRPSEIIKDKLTLRSPSKKVDAISLYGDTNWKEAFAESFCAYVHGVEPTKRGLEYHKAFKEYMKDNGFDFFEGCLFRGISSAKSTNGKSVSGRKVENGKASGPFQRPVVTVAPRRPVVTVAPRRPSIPKSAPSPEPPKKRENTPPPSSGKPKTSTEKPTPKKPSTNGKPSVPSTPKKPTTKEKPSTNGKSVVEKPKPKTKAKPSTNGTSTPKPPTEKPKTKKPVVKKPTVKKPSTTSPKVTGFKLKKGASQAEVDKARSNIEKLITKYGLGFTLSDYASFRKKYGSPVTTIGFKWNNKKFSAKDKLITDAWDKISAKELAQSFNIFDTLTDV